MLSFCYIPPQQFLGDRSAWRREIATLQCITQDYPTNPQPLRQVHQNLRYTLSYRMVLHSSRVSILLVVWAGLTANSYATVCETELERAQTPVQLSDSTISVVNPGLISANCRPLIFTDLFPIDTCDTSSFPPPGGATYAPDHLVRQAAIYGIKQLQTTASLSDLGLAPALLAASIDIDELKSVAHIIDGRLSEFVDPTCSATVSRSDDALKQQLLDYSAIGSLRQLLGSLTPRKAVVWPQNIVNPVAFLSRPDTRTLIDSLIYQHNLNCVLLLISDLEISVSQLLDSTQSFDTEAAPDQAVTEPGIDSDLQTPVPEETESATEPQAEVTDGSGLDSPADSGKQENVTESPEEEQLRLDRIEFADWLVGVEKDLEIRTIRALKGLKKAGHMPAKGTFRIDANTNLSHRGSYTGHATRPGGLSDLEKEQANNPIYSDTNTRSTAGKSEASKAGEDADQNTAIKTLTEAHQELNATFLQHKNSISERVNELKIVVDNLSRQVQGEQPQVSTQSLQVQIRALQKSLASYTDCCGKVGTQQKNTLASDANFYSYENLSKVLSVLKHFMNNYRLYKATVGSWIPSRTKRLAHGGNSGNANAPAPKQVNGAVINPKKLFKQLTRSGNVFKDTISNGLALNEIFKALNLNSKTIKSFHPNQPQFAPLDYTKLASDIFGSTKGKGDNLGVKIPQGDSFYSKVISSIQNKYPQLEECCIVGFAALSITSLGTIVAILVCCVSICCERSQANCTPCCRVRNKRDTCGWISPCCGGEGSDSSAHPDAEFQPFTHARHSLHIPAASAHSGSAQRDSTSVTAPLLHPGPPQLPVKDWSTWRQVPQTQADTRV